MACPISISAARRVIALSALVLIAAALATTTAVPADTPPTCVIAGPAESCPYQEVCFDGSQSYDPDDCASAPPCPGEGIVSYSWDLGDPAGADLLDNGDFEGGYNWDGADLIADGWTKQELSGDVDWFDYQSVAPPGIAPHGGSQCQVAYFHELSGPTDARIYQTVADLTPGGSYTLTAWIALIDCGSPDLVCQVGYDLNGGTDFTWLETPPGDGEWHQASADLVATGAAITVAYRWVGTPDPGEPCDNWALADDASLVERPSGPTACHTYTEYGTYTVALTVTDDEGATATCTHQLEVVLCPTPPPEWVHIPLTDVGWHLISLPLEPVDHSILLNRETGRIDELSIFYSSYLAGNDPRNRLFRVEPGVGYWTYNPNLYPDQSWYEIGVEPPPGKPDPGPWWQGFWSRVDVPHTLSYLAWSPFGPVTRERFIDISRSPSDWSWVLIGACARVPYPYQGDVTTWPATSLTHDLMWGRSTPPTPPSEWLPTADCDGPDARDQGLIGLPLVGLIPPPIEIYYSASPSQVGHCGAPADTEDLVPGQAYWLDVEDREVWMRVEADQWP